MASVPSRGPRIADTRQVANILSREEAHVDGASYLADFCVRDFIGWMSNFVSGRRQLHHLWSSRRDGSYRFDSLYSAYTQYHWGGKNFHETEEFLEGSRIRLRQSIGIRDEKGFQGVCRDVLGWGGIPRIQVPRMDCLETQSRLINPKRADTDDIDGVIYMSSGLSKIYSLMVDDLPIYDSRVACALISFVYLYAAERSYVRLPPTLVFRYPPSRSADRYRNPFGFPMLRSMPRQYAESNLMAAWVLKALCAVGGDFISIPEKSRMLAVQSAMFMLGYSALDESRRILDRGMSPLRLVW